MRMAPGRAGLAGTFSKATIAVVALLGPLSCHRGGDPVLVQLASARALVGNLRTGLSQTVQATDRAVLAETDEASQAFAREARELAGRVEGQRDRLGPLLQELGFQDEVRDLEVFSARWGELRKVGDETLKLAVENTNLKARRLSFGPVAAAADALEAALEAGLVHPAGRGDSASARLLASRAELAIRKVQILQGPHIAEADDGVMSKLEDQMAALEKQASDAVVTLEPSLGPASASAAHAALDRFLSQSKELLSLSRRNTNVISLSLAMTRLPPLTSACDVAVDALAQALDKRGFTGTR